MVTVTIQFRFRFATRSTNNFQLRESSVWTWTFDETPNDPSNFHVQNKTSEFKRLRCHKRESILLKHLLQNNRYKKKFNLGELKVANVAFFLKPLNDCQKIEFFWISFFEKDRNSFDEILFFFWLQHDLFCEQQQQLIQILHLKVFFKETAYQRCLPNKRFCEILVDKLFFKRIETL